MISPVSVSTAVWTIVGGRLGAAAVTHRPGIRLAIDQHGASFRIEPAREPVEFGASGLQRSDGNRHRLGGIVRLRIVCLIQFGEISGDLPVEAGHLLGNLLAPYDPLATCHGAE